MKLQYPKIISSPPGPKSKKLMKMREKYVPNNVFRVAPIFVSEGRDAIVKDVDGNTYIDFSSGISVLNVGHCNPTVVKAVKEQADKYLHTCFHVLMYEPYVRLAEKLAKITPGKMKKTVLLNSGAEAVENAVKIARRYTGKPGIVTFEHAFHGRTLLSMSLTGKVTPYKFGFGPFAPSIHRIPYAYCYRCPYGLEYPACDLRCVNCLEESFATGTPPEDIAAVIVEPVQGEGGFIVPPKEFLPRLGKICDKNGFLLIADEVQCGMGRTGKMFAVEHWKVVPDLITTAKALGGGLPIAAVTGREEVMEKPQYGGLGTTFGGNPLSCVAALKTIDIIQRSLPNARKIGNLIMKKLKEMQEKYRIIGDVRGLGLMIAIELVKNRKTKTPAKEEKTKIITECYKHGLIALGAGTYDNVIRILPPLNISEELATKGLDILEEAVKAKAR